MRSYLDEESDSVNFEELITLEEMSKSEGNDEKILSLVHKIEKNSLTPKNYTKVIKALGIAGNYFFRQKTAEKLIIAENQYERALKYALKYDDPLATKFYNKIGTVWMVKNNALTAADYFYRGLAHAETTTNIVGEFFSLYFLGKNHLESKMDVNRPECVKYFKKAFIRSKSVLDHQERIKLMNIALDRLVQCNRLMSSEEVGECTRLLEDSLAFAQRNNLNSERMLLKEKLAIFYRNIGEFKRTELIYVELIKEVDREVSGKNIKPSRLLYNKIYYSNSLALLYRNLGELQKALEIFKINSEIAIGINDASLSIFCRSNSAFVLTALGEFLEARTVLEDIIEETKRSKDFKGLSFALGGLGWLQSFTNIKKALTYYSQSIERFEQLEMRVPVKIIFSVAALLLEQKETPKIANKHVEYFLDLVNSIHPDDPEHPRRLIIEAKMIQMKNKGNIGIERARKILLKAYQQSKKNFYRELEIDSLLELTRLEINQDPLDVSAIQDYLSWLVITAEEDSRKHLVAEIWLVQGLLAMYQRDYTTARNLFKKTCQLADKMKYKLIKERCERARNNLNILTKAVRLYDHLDVKILNKYQSKENNLEDVLEDAREYMRQATIMRKQFHNIQNDRNTLV
ncbi:MAG: tetratricopeptide repeat protein [Candidatus Hodarchaeales archaeon]